jgi:hypothetical protein
MIVLFSCEDRNPAFKSGWRECQYVTVVGKDSPNPKNKTAFFLGMAVFFDSTQKNSLESQSYLLPPGGGARAARFFDTSQETIPPNNPMPLVWSQLRKSHNLFYGNQLKSKCSR